MPINELKAAAQHKFQRRLKLTAEGRQLDLKATLSEAGLRDGDAVVSLPIWLPLIGRLLFMAMGATL